MIALMATAMLCSCAHYPWQKKKKRYVSGPRIIVVDRPTVHGNAAKLRTQGAQISALRSAIESNHAEAVRLQSLLEKERQNREVERDPALSDIKRNIEKQREILGQ